MSSPAVRLRLDAEGTAELTFEATADGEALQVAVSALVGDALGAGGLHRVEVSVPADDPVARRALLRSGFRLEGCRRAVARRSDGSRQDLLLLARLVGDPVGGPTGFSGVMNTVLPRKRVIAHVLIRELWTAGAERFLLCETRFKADWELPGGVVEPLEPPRVGAVREVQEELGVELAVGRLLVADWMPPYLGWEDALELIFDGGSVTPADLETFVLQPSEIIRAELVTLEQAAELVTPLAHRRLSAALALGAGDSAYLEDGRPGPPPPAGLRPVRDA